MPDTCAVCESPGASPGALRHHPGIPAHPTCAAAYERMVPDTLTEVVA